MTVAVDIKTGAVVGQVLDPPRSLRVEKYRAEHLDEWVVRILARDGKYFYVPAATVRLEEV